ncbi:MAG: ABC transporter permease [Thermoguttaceae bacterium]
MSLWKVAWRSIRQRSLVSTLTVLSMGLGVALVVAVLVVYGVVDQSFHRGGEGYDLIVGAKGGREQLVLNTVFYLSEPIGNIPYNFYDELSDGKYGPVETLIPVCMGHTYQSFRVVGTVPDIFELKYRGDEKYRFAEGRNFKVANHFEAVLGAIAASKTSTHVGETIKITHGSGTGAHVHDEGFEVVGVLEPTGTPVDRAVFVNMLGFQEIHHHEDASAEEEHGRHDEHAGHADEPKEITAVLVCIHKEDADRGMTDVMSKLINNTKVAQAVAPLKVITELFENVIGKLQWILLGMAVVTVIVAGIGIMVSIYNSMSDRRHEIAVMRALGASRFTVMLIILMESILLSLLGGAMGLLLGHGAIWLCSPIIADWTGVVIGLLQFQWSEFWLIFGLVLLASAVGYLPAMSAYRTDVAKSLITTP